MGSHTPPYESWADAATNIQTAINAAGVGETIWVTNNATYTLSVEIALNKAVTVKAFGGEPLPVINGNGAVRGFNISSSGATLDGLIISNGYHASSGGGITMSGGNILNCTIVSNAVPSASGNVYGGGIYMTGGTVSNCSILRNHSYRFNGGVSVHGANALLIDCLFDDNRTTVNYGGGIGMEAAARIVRCTFTNNSAFSGGAIYMTGGTVRDCIVVTNRASNFGGGIYMTGGTVSNCDVRLNRVPTTSGDVYGGGVYMTGGTVTNCTIRYNYCDRRYGGVALVGATAKLLGCILEGNRSITFPGAGAGLEAAALIDGCLFTNNICSGGGGGVTVQFDGAIVRNSRFYANQGNAGGGVYMTFAGIISNCVFVGNNGTGEGGAMYIDKGTAVNCVMIGNTAGASGGGGTMTRVANRATLRNCLVTGNTGADYSGGIISISANGLILENCTVSDNNRYGVFQWSPGSVLTTNSIVYFNTNNCNRTTDFGYSCMPGLSGNGNTASNPQFVNRPAGDYSLAKSSPCLNLGLSQAWMAGALDLNNKKRLAGPGVDMGAYEYQPRSGSILLVK